MNNLRGVSSFIETAKNGSFTAAGEALGISQSAVSQNVKRLENELGVRLITRSTRRMSLTEEGTLFFRRAQAALGELDLASRELLDLAKDPSGTVRITSTVSFGRHFIAPLLLEFAREYPKVSVELSLSDRFVDLTGEGFDIGIRGTAQPAENMVARTVMPVHMVTCAAPQYLQTYGAPSLPENLKSHKCIRYRFSSSGKLLEFEFQKGKEIFVIEVPKTIIVDDNDVAVSYAVEGFGVLQISAFDLPAYLEDGRLVQLLPALTSRHRSLYIHYPTARLSSKRVKVLIEFLLDRLVEVRKFVLSRIT